MKDERAPYLTEAGLKAIQYDKLKENYDELSRKYESLLEWMTIAQRIINRWHPAHPEPEKSFWLDDIRLLEAEPAQEDTTEANEEAAYMGCKGSWVQIPPPRHTQTKKLTRWAFLFSRVKAGELGLIRYVCAESLIHQIAHIALK